MASNVDNVSVPVPCIREGPTPNSAVERRHRSELAFFGKMLHKRQYVSGCDGNLSVRLDERRILTTPTGRSKGMLKPEDMIIIDARGNKLAGTLPPSSEIGMHLTIYQTRPDVGAVVHAHP